MEKEHSADSEDKSIIGHILNCNKDFSVIISY